MDFLHHKYIKCALLASTLHSIVIMINAERINGGGGFDKEE